MNRETIKAPMDTDTIRAEAVERHYGITWALRGVDLSIGRGEILGVVGHNGAGKSTLVRILAGREQPDAGRVVWKGVRGGRWDSAAASAAGMRMVYQELALCPDLTVAENAALSDPRRPGFRWRKTAERRIAATLDAVFPGHGISVLQRVGDLPLAQRQIVEIARALCSDDISLLILDEPTESLSLDATTQLYRHLRSLADSGVSILLISHRMHEVLANTDRIIVMKDGAVVDELSAASASEDELLAAMGSVSGPRGSAARAVSSTSADRRVVASVQLDNGQALEVRAGELLGLAGLAGQGQERLLERLWRAGRGTTVSGRRAYVPGDRQTSGILPLWPVADNLTISALNSVSRFGVVRGGAKRALAAEWIAALQVRGNAGTPITALSGGNQQKVIVARAFASDATIVLLDDPFRGVDAATKNDLYALMKTESSAGRTIVWYSTENAEMVQCDRVVVLRAGRITSELEGDAIIEERIIADSFDKQEEGVG